ncbi:MAG TPA: right-handed parallel beta-helix repeat-containing protein [Candidatus Acidoferrum sp.]|nr:right-handed parallel beta-helix repeat-containing protein [Candidatus Acidoferrum sp.]
MSKNRNILSASARAVLTFVFVFGVATHYGDTLHAAGGSHAPIVIASDSDFQVCNCVLSGSGTTADPYIIGPWAINSTGQGATAVSVEGTLLTKSFSLFNLTVAGNGSNTSTGIVLSHINPSGQKTISAAVTGVQTSIQSNGVGIVVENSSFVTLDGGGANPNGPGIASTGAGTINKNFMGAIDIENSSNVTVKGWQFSANGQDNTPDFLAFDPSLANWGVGAVRVFGSKNTLIDHNAANNCTTVSFSLLNSNHNTISNNTADYPFTSNVMIADGSSFNVVSNNSFGTADFVGILIADPLPGTATLNQFGPSHDNLIQGNSDHTDGATGTERHSGIEPSFAGGIVILNGTYNNTIAGNQVTASGGGDLAWAQAIPDPNSPNGVVPQPPVIHCNVTASEGGGGVANHNGNVWSGNTAKQIDACISQQ